MAKTKISTIAKELNVALPTVYSFLSEKGISIEESPNTRVDDDVVGLLVSKFKPDKDLKNKSDQFAANRRSTPAPAPKEAAPEAKPEVPTDDSSVQGPRILGKLELDSKGNPVIKKPAAPAPAPKPEPVKAEAPKTEAPKAEVKPAPAQPQEAPKTEAPKPEPVKEEAPKAAPAPPAKPETTPEAKPEQKQEAPAAAEPEVFAPSTPRPSERKRHIFRPALLRRL